MATTATKKPTGLSITRNGLKFTLTWKKGDTNYSGGQQLQYRTCGTGGWTAWTSVTISASATSKAVSLTAASYYPTTSKKLTQIEFRVRGMRAASGTDAFSWSDWVSKGFSIAAPNAPKASQTLSSDYANVTTFSWTTSTSTDDAKHFYNCEWQSILVKESDVTDGAKLSWKSSATGWQTGTGSASGTKVITEDTATLAAAAYTRWFRVRARGCTGASKWVYTKHVYSVPFVPKITKVAKEGAQTWIRVRWSAASSASHPIDTTEVQWTIDTPAAGRACPTGATWETGATLKDTSGADEVFFLVDDAPEDDECLWVRVVVKHDNNTSATDPKYVFGSTLADPDDLSVSVGSSYSATVGADNNSDVPDSKLAVLFRQKGKKDVVVGIIAHGDASAEVQCPAWESTADIAFGVYAFQGTATAKAGANGSYSYSVSAKMKSATIWEVSTVPSEPSNVTVERSESDGEVIVSWGWAWSDANQAELSWSENPNAWESTQEPSTYVIKETGIARWRISDLEMGKRWYFRVRLIKDGEAVTYGPYCETLSIDLTSAPEKPVLTLMDSVIQPGENITASWSYITTDGTRQAFAEIAEYQVINNVATYTTIKTATTSKTAAFAPPNGWNLGETHQLVVRVTSESGLVSEWSDPVSISIAPAVSIASIVTSLSTATIESETYTALKALPLTVTVTGAGAGGTTAVVIERAEDYMIERPDGTVFNGYAGETIFDYSQTGEGQITITKDDLIGSLDAVAMYNMIVTITDTYGQTASQTILFMVVWDNYAAVPSASTAVVQNGIAVLSPVLTAQGTFTCDIYRLSADRPVLVVKDAAFGVNYVDPYPVIGNSGGYRFVCKSINGDYITGDGDLAWKDTGGYISSKQSLIDFGGEQIELEHNMQISHQWKKAFTETTYLGGSVQGDWNLAVNRSASISADIATDDLELIARIRRLAVYAGICHVRTVDGSSFAADIQVSESRSHEQAGMIAMFTLTITRVDTEDLDGLLYSEWVTT